MKDYHNLTLKFHVLLLADVIERIRNNSIKSYGLCPSHYLSAPGLSWNSMHKMTKIKLELIPILTCTYSLKKAEEVEFLIFSTDTAKPKINIWNFMTQNKSQNILYT